jgi:hypothetical protein
MYDNTNLCRAAGLEKQRGVATRLTHLGLGGSGIGPEGIASLVPIFLPNPASTAAGRPGDARGGGGGGVLMKLDLSACALGPLGVKALAPLLLCNSRLRELSLSYAGVCWRMLAYADVC